MDKGKRISIKSITLGPIITLSVIAIISNLISLRGVRIVHNSGVEIAQTHLTRVELLGKIQNEIQLVHKYSLSHVVSTTLDNRVAMIDYIRNVENNLDNYLVEYEKLLSQEELNSFKNLEETYEEFKLEVNQLLAYSGNDQKDVAYALANGSISELSDSMETFINEMIESTTVLAQKATGELDSVYTQSKALASIMTFLTTACVVSSILLLVIFFTRPLANAIEAIKDIINGIDQEQGDLTKRIEIKANNEIRDMTNAMNVFLDKLQKIMKAIIENTVTMENVIDGVQQSVRTSNDGASDLSAVTQELSATMQEVGNSSNKINTNTGDVRDNVDIIATRSTEISEYTKQMKSNANAMEKTARDNMEETEKKVSEILTVLNQAIENSKSVDQVNSLTNEILNISSQTNLLALNASIEAARAGEAGKGFSVVAEEIRQLADTSRETANRIQEINSLVTSAVHNLSDNAEELVSYMHETILPEFSNFVDNGVQYRENADFIEASMTQFVEQTDTLKAEIDEIAKAIETITSAIEDGAKGVNGAAESTQLLVEDMDSISNKMDENAMIAHALRSETAIFKNF